MGARDCWVVGVVAIDVKDYKGQNWWRNWCWECLKHGEGKVSEEVVRFLEL